MQGGRQKKQAQARHETVRQQGRGRIRREQGKNQRSAESGRRRKTAAHGPPEEHRSGGLQQECGKIGPRHTAHAHAQKSQQGRTCKPDRAPLRPRCEVLQDRARRRMPIPGQRSSNEPPVVLVQAGSSAWGGPRGACYAETALWRFAVQRAWPYSPRASGPDIESPETVPRKV